MCVCVRMCMYMCVCARVCMYTCACVCMLFYMFVCMGLYVFGYVCGGGGSCVRHFFLVSGLVLVLRPVEPYVAD